ncbi:MAG TPA: PIG-L family deacetylase [Burkholderiaceae bacterium]
MHVVVSPHLDDAVLSAGTWLAAYPGALVVTVFAGMPHDGGKLTDWDRRAGFASAAEAVAARRAEDRAALAVLQAEPLWLDHVDDQYAEPHPLEMLVASLRAVLRRHAPAQVLAPLGLFHRDHVLTQRACVHAMQAEGVTALTAYEDAIYRAIPGCLQQALLRLARDGVQATPALDQPGGGHPDRKARALQAYASQCQAFSRDQWDDALRPERHWQLTWPHAAPWSDGHA